VRIKLLKVHCISKSEQDKFTHLPKFGVPGGKERFIRKAGGDISTSSIFGSSTQFQIHEFYDSVATIYNTLKTLYEKGIIVQYYLIVSPVYGAICVMKMYQPSL
jgi:hypothetical protein